jgi:hypothetical protein
MSEREPLFHVGCLTLVIAAVFGYPLGASVAEAIWGHNTGLLGGFLGFLVMMFIIGYLNRRRQIARESDPD